MKPFIKLSQIQAGLPTGDVYIDPLCIEAIAPDHAGTVIFTSTRGRTFTVSESPAAVKEEIDKVKAARKAERDALFEEALQRDRRLDSMPLPPESQLG